MTLHSLTGDQAGISWQQQLQPASYRGIQFGVLGSEVRFGRRNAVHEYPYRDTVWIEDLGRQARRINIIGFLVGDDVIAQREQLIAAVESADDGELVHATLGQLTVNVMDFSTVERWDKGRYLELNFSFIEAGKRVFPSSSTSTSDAITNAAGAADVAASADFVTRTTASLKQGAAVVKAAVSTASSWAFNAQKLANDATNLYHSINSLPGTFGRYFGGKRRSGFGNFTSAIQATGSSVQQLISLGSVARKNVSTASSVLISNASSLGL